MTIMCAIDGKAPGVARVRIRANDLRQGDVLVVAIDAASAAWRAAGDVLLHEDRDTAAKARIVVESGLVLQSGASAAICVYSDGFVIATRTQGVSVLEVKLRRPSGGWCSRLNSIAGVEREFVGTGIAQFEVEGSSFSEMAGAFLLVAALQLDMPERGENFRGVVRGSE